MELSSRLRVSLLMTTLCQVDIKLFSTVGCYFVTNVALQYGKEGGHLLALELIRSRAGESSA